jgi:hypothetical protein
MEIFCFGAVVLWALVFGLAGVAASFATSRSDNESNAKHAFPPDSYEVFINARSITHYSLNAGTLNGNGQFCGFNISSIREFSPEEITDLQANFLKVADFRSVSKPFEPQNGLRINDGKEFVDIVIDCKHSAFIVHFKDKKRVGSMNKSIEGILTK